MPRILSGVAEITGDHVRMGLLRDAEYKVGKSRLSYFPSLKQCCLNTCLIYISGCLEALREMWKEIDKLWRGDFETLLDACERQTQNMRLQTCSAIGYGLLRGKSFLSKLANETSVSCTLP